MITGAERILMLASLKTELKKLYSNAKTLDRNIVILLTAIAVLQTIGWYYTSRGFFRRNFFDALAQNPDIFLIEYLYWFVGDFLVYFAIPLLLIIVIHKKPLKNYGMTLGEKRIGFPAVFLFLAVMLPILWFVSAQDSFTATYPHLYQAKISWRVFFIYETGMLLYMIGWEFLWRGYMLFGLYEKFGFYAILMQMIPFVILHNGKPALETFGAILGGIALGILALRTRSFIYCVLIHFGVMFGIDLLSTLRHRAADYGIGFDSLLNLLRELFR